jgi:hypothetical protein
LLITYSGLSRAISDDVVGLQEGVREVSKGIAELRVGQERRGSDPSVYVHVHIPTDVLG